MFSPHFFVVFWFPLLQFLQLKPTHFIPFFHQELYQKYVDGDDEYKKIKEEDDPFYDPPEDLMIGTANVFLQSLSYALDFDDKLTISDYKVSHGTRILQIMSNKKKGKIIFSEKGKIYPH